MNNIKIYSGDTDGNSNYHKIINYYYYKCDIQNYESIKNVKIVTISCNCLCVTNKEEY